MIIYAKYVQKGTMTMAEKLGQGIDALICAIYYQAVIDYNKANCSLERKQEIEEFICRNDYHISEGTIEKLKEAMPGFTERKVTSNGNNARFRY